MRATENALDTLRLELEHSRDGMYPLVRIRVTTHALLGSPVATPIVASNMAGDLLMLVAGGTPVCELLMHPADMASLEWSVGQPSGALRMILGLPVSRE